MKKLSKRTKAIHEKLPQGKSYPIVEALKLAKQYANAKFDESVDIIINLNIDARKSEQAIRGAVVLPNGTGKKVRVAVFAQGANATKAQEAGADIVGFEDLAETIKSGKMDFDVLVATPDAMGLVGKLGQVLGPRGLMPNPKLGTVTPDVATAIKNAKSGQARYRSDKAGIVHTSIGKASFAPEKLQENFNTLISAVKKAKPAGVKGTFLKKIFVSTTMGPGLLVDQAGLGD
ncbi:MAG: 50S ribosomal protein L1 [Proteobacteria bacterium]|nr:50S ribosomal protein L1 [Pseudomonadota bacterium]